MIVRCRVAGLRQPARILLRAGLAVLLSLVFCEPGGAWGARGHRLVNAAAIENLPEPLRSYFRVRKQFFVEHAIDPDLLARDDPRERPHHYTEVEAYEPYPFATFRKSFVVERRGPAASQLLYGDSLWQVEAFTLRLAEAFRHGRWSDVDHAAVFAAHYACDLTQPLHTVLNYDGQFTNQSGIHSRFETQLVEELAEGWVFKPQPALDEADLRARIFREMLDSYSFRDRVFAADRIAVAGRTYQDPEYFRSFQSIAGLLARKRLEAAASFVSSLWYTAWVRAGKPGWKRPGGGGGTTAGLRLAPAPGAEARRSVTLSGRPPARGLESSAWRERKLYSSLFPSRSP